MSLNATEGARLQVHKRRFDGRACVLTKELELSACFIWPAPSSRDDQSECQIHANAPRDGEFERIVLVVGAAPF